MTYYIDYCSPSAESYYTRLKSLILFKFNVIDIDKDRKVIYINKKYINKRAYKKLSKYTRKQGISPIAENSIISNCVQCKIQMLTKYSKGTKMVMRAAILQLLEYIKKIIGVDYRNECIHICVCNEYNKMIVASIAEQFKTINIVTTRVGSMRRMEKSIQKDNDYIFSITNNRSKSLKRARIVINIDFNNKTFSDFVVNRNCLIINLNTCKLDLGTHFQGSIIEDVDVDFKNQYGEHIDETHYNRFELLESFIPQSNYEAATTYLSNCKCRIKGLIGVRGTIQSSEILHNFRNSAIKLDKLEKKD